MKEANPGVVLKHKQCQDIKTSEPGTLNLEPFSLGRTNIDNKLPIRYRQAPNESFRSNIMKAVQQLQVRGIASIGIVEYWARSEAFAISWVLASGSQGLRLGEDNGRVSLENQNGYNCIDFLVIVAYFLGRKQKMDV